jgi:hypothetical protein
MTRTRSGLLRLASRHARARGLASVLAGIGLALGIGALGLAMAPRAYPILLAWAGMIAALGLALVVARRAGRHVDAQHVGRMVERSAHARAGSVLGVAASAPAAGSPALWAAADLRAADLVERSGPAVNTELGRGSRRRLALGALVVLGGALAFAGGSPASGRAAAFWHPLRTWRDARAPVRLSVERTTVPRGGTVDVLIEVPAATRAVLWTRGAGESWSPRPVALDSLGQARVTLGPLTADVHLRAASGGRSSAEQHVSVRLPAFLVDLALTARFPSYLERGDEPIMPGPDTVTLPAGTTILARGSASVALRAAGFTREGAADRTVALRTDGTGFDGRFVPGRSGTWTLSVEPLEGDRLEDEPARLTLRLLADSAPSVMVPVPGRDTTLPVSLRQPLVIDARDDHGIARLAIVSWRASQTGRVGTAVRESLDVSGAGDRAIVQTELALEERGLLPGDTLRFYVEAGDNAPQSGVGRSQEFALRLPTRAEMRAATRAAAAEVAAAAESVAAAQRELGDRTRDLSQERVRDGGATGEQARDGQRAGAQQGTLNFQATQRAEEVARDQAALAQRVDELSQAVEDIARAMRAAGLEDSAFQARLREVQQLLERAITPEMQERLRELQDALQRLDPEATRQALERLAEAQRRLREELERSEELFRRAAVEGSLASLAEDARDLRERQREWNRDDAPRADSVAAAAERELVRRADSLRAGVTQAQRDLAAAQRQLDASRNAAQRAGQAMRRAEQRAAAGDPQGAQEAGEEAADALSALPEELLAQRDSLASQWRQETLAALDRAMSEAASLAERQRELAGSLRRGEGGARERGQQASIEEGTLAVERQIREAAGRNALVSPQLEGALNHAQRQMRGARQQLEQGTPNTGAAAQLAEQALDALNATAHALARSRGAVAGSQSGSGMAEAMEQLAQMAREQQGLNQQAGAMMPSLGQGQGMMDQMRELGARQRALAEQLDRMRAEGGSESQAAALAQEARELARRLESGRLDRQTVERQERLYRRMLDAGRSLQGSETDERKERTSRAATGEQLQRPGPLAPGATGSGPRVRYPTWDELRAMSPNERRLVLEYFRRLNAPAAPKR